MTKVIDIEDRLKLEQKKKLKVDKAKKMEAVRKVLQCTRCLARCHKCGMQFDTTKMYQRYQGQFRFCESCQEEYDEYRRLWQTWLDYQEALREYGESPEFMDLVREVEWDR
jgi:hypothetical protein